MEIEDRQAMGQLVGQYVVYCNQPTKVIRAELASLYYRCDIAYCLHGHFTHFCIKSFIQKVLSVSFVYL